MSNDAQPPDQQHAADVQPKTTAPADEPTPERLGQLVPAVVGALAVLIVLAVRGTANPPSPLSIFAAVAVVAAVVVAIVAMLPKRYMDIAGSTRVSAWQVAVRTAYLALAAAALYVSRRSSWRGSGTTRPFRRTPCSPWNFLRCCSSRSSWPGPERCGCRPSAGRSALRVPRRMVRHRTRLPTTGIRHSGMRLECCSASGSRWSCSRSP